VTGVIAAIAAQGAVVFATPSVLMATGSVSQITSGTTTVTPAGQTYSWSYVSGDASIFALSPSSQSTAFRANGVPPSTTLSAIWQCAVPGYGLAFVEIELTRT